MVRDLLFTASGIAIGVLGLVALRGWITEDAKWCYAQARKLTEKADEATKAAETIETRYNLLVEPTQSVAVIAQRDRGIAGIWREWRSQFTPVSETPDWAPGEVLAMATLGTDPVHPDPLPPPPPPSPRRQPWDRHINRSGWPNASVNPKAVRLVARLADLPNPAMVAARLAKLPDPTRAYRTARSF